MKKFWAIGMIMGLASFLVLAPAYAVEDTEKSFGEIKQELQAKGLASAEIDEAKGPIVEMLGKGATKDEIVKPALDLSNNGVGGRDLKLSLDSMNDLVKNGKSPLEAGNIVSQAVAQAKTEGLKGAALADKVHQATQAMQAEKQAAQELKKEEKEITGSVETTPETIGEKTKKANDNLQKLEDMDMGKGKAGASRKP